MAKIADVGGHRFEIPDDEYTGAELQEKAGTDRDAIPVIRRGSKDIAVEPAESVRLEPGDNVIFTTPVESASQKSLRHARGGTDYESLIRSERR